MMTTQEQINMARAVNRSVYPRKVQYEPPTCCECPETRFWRCIALSAIGCLVVIGLAWARCEGVL